MKRTSSDKEFIRKWNRFCWRCRFLCCCCQYDGDDDNFDMPKPILVNDGKGSLVSLPNLKKSHSPTRFYRDIN